MNTSSLFSPGNGIISLSKEESKMINGGTWLYVAPFVAIGALAGAAIAIFEFGKSTGNFIYHLTH